MANEVDVEAASPGEAAKLLSPDGVELSWEQEKSRHDAKRAAKGWKYWVFLISLAILVSIAIATSLTFLFRNHWSKPAQLSSDQPICETGMARAEWRSLPRHRRHAYIVAVQRLSTLPSRLGLNTSLYDDFTYVHIQLGYQVHHAAISLPWHRWFLHVYETTLREEGGFDGYMPYWDWTLDSVSPMKSPIWDEWAGFGGNGPVSGGCVTDGILTSMTPSYAEEGYSPHCVTRNFDHDIVDGEMHGKQYTAEIVRDIIDTSETYDEFRERLESGPHRHLHLGIGGEMPTISSPNDPLFFVHHAQIDRLYWLWQQKNPEKRNHEFFGPLEWTEKDAAMAEGTATLEDNILMLGLAKDLTVHDVLKTDSSILCYKYSMEY